MNLYLIDGFHYLFRSHYATPPMHNDQGQPTNALYGFIRSILRLKKEFSLQHCVLVFDGEDNKKTRQALYEEYKKNRKETPPEILAQLPLVFRFCQYMGLPLLSIPEVEADDVIGSLAKQAEKEGKTVYICSADKDFCQLVSSSVFLLNPFQGNQLTDEKAVQEKFGVLPAQIPDYLALVGDSSDNIPGVTGIGPKNAAQLLQKAGSIETLLANPSLVASEKKRATLERERKQGLLSKELATIKTDLPLSDSLSSFAIHSPQLDKLLDFYRENNFHSLVKREMETKTENKRNECHAQIVRNEKECEHCITSLKQAKTLFLWIDSALVAPFEYAIAHIAIAESENKAWIFSQSDALSLKQCLQQLKPLLEQSHITIYGHNIKQLHHLLFAHDITLKGNCFDIMLASYVLNTSTHDHSLAFLLLTHCNEVLENTSLPQQLSQGNALHHWINQSITGLCQLALIFKEKIEKSRVKTLFFAIETPLIPILTEMERRGIHFDVTHCQKMHATVAKAIAEQEKAIFELAGREFNLNSPKQLSSVLYEDLALPSPQKKKGNPSTEAKILEKLALQYPIAKAILEYRSVEKLRSTYLEPLPKEINRQTQRIHCTFNQSATFTGRLACESPNLQNIPIRTDLGKEIRAGFRPQQSNWLFLSADYSQIELRLLAHLSEDPLLIEAFERNIDIHTHTAAQLFACCIDEVTSEQRRRAKTIHFSILYGKQAFGLSQELSLSVAQAKQFIEAYFSRYRRVKEYIEQCKQQVFQTKTAVTMAGRERFIPEVSSSQWSQRAFAERLAVNTPIQGSCADLIKCAMIAIKNDFDASPLSSQLLLQIHDELLFEGPESEMALLKKRVKDKMEGVWKLRVPLVVNFAIGKNWKEC